MKYNPFQPNGVIAPGAFAGRIPEIRSIEHALFQAKNGNPIHFMIQGERGIGKTSLFYVIKITADGSIPAIDETQLNFLVVSVDLGGANTQLDIIRSLGRELRTVLDEREVLKSHARSFWQWVTNWEVLGVRYHKDTAAIDPEDALDELVNRVSTLCGELKHQIDGILFLVDEADRPGEEAGLGAFCKAFTERLARRSCTNVILGLAGLPSLLTKLRRSHESSPRIFTTILLEPLLPEERASVIHSAIKKANETNIEKTSIDDDAVSLLASLSEGYPHFIQQFGYSAFEADTDSVITLRDVFAGAFEENGAISQLGDKYFSEMYHSKIASNDYRTVLNTMARHGSTWVSRKQIIDESGVSSSIVTNALNALKAREIIIADESRKGRGFYRLPTRSFAAWINAIRSIGEKAGVTHPFVSSPSED